VYATPSGDGDGEGDDDGVGLELACVDVVQALASNPTTTITDDARDAARYRWLRKEHFPTADNPPLAQVVWKAFDNRHSSDWANMIDGDDLDRAIDAALSAAQSASASEAK